MIDFLKFNDDISDEMLAAYIDGNATIEECDMIQKSISSDDLLSEVADVVNDFNSFGKDANWQMLDDSIESVSSVIPVVYSQDDLMAPAAIQEPPEIDIELPPLDNSDDFNIGEDTSDDLFDLNS